MNDHHIRQMYYIIGKAPRVIPLIIHILSFIPLGVYMRKKKRRKPRLRNTQHTLEEFRRLFYEYGCICVICGESFSFEEITKDHIVPRSRGGSDYISNIQPACSECNRRKSRQARDYRPHIPFWAAAKKNKGGRGVEDDRDIPEE